jgi:hypothetical protein
LSQTLHFGNRNEASTAANASFGASLQIVATTAITVTVGVYRRDLGRRPAYRRGRAPGLSSRSRAPPKSDAEKWWPIIKEAGIKAE